MDNHVKSMVAMTQQILIEIVIEDKLTDILQRV